MQEMDSASLDHYEKQLYSVFKTFDVDNEEALDRPAVLDLCNALQLEERSSTLVDTLFEKPTDRVTFTHFRNGLLSVLGGGETSTPMATHSDDDSSGREVAPKYVYGSKKYGRRSKPQSVGSPSSRDDSTGDTSIESPRVSIERDNIKLKTSVNSPKRLTLENMNDGKVIYDALDPKRYIDYEESVILCKNINMDGVDRKIIKKIFMDSTSDSNKITIGEFFHKLLNSLTMSITSNCHDNTVLSNDNVKTNSFEVGSYNGVIETKKVLEAWEQAGVEDGQRLIHELGFTAPTLHVSDLCNALDEELRVLSVHHNPPPNDARVLLLQASLSLHRYHFITIKHIMEQVFIENKKMKNDLFDANRRAQAMALEVDENHARLETSLNSKIKLMETKHAESLKLLTAEWSVEKDKATATIAQLEEAAAHLTAEEAYLKSENNTLTKDNEELRKKCIISDDKIVMFEKSQAQLTKELKVLTAENAKSKKTKEEQKAFKELASCIEDLQLQNKLLRDRNDELCAEVDSLTSSTGHNEQKLNFMHSTPLSFDIANEKVSSWRDEADSFDCGERPVKRRGDSPSLASCDDESPRVGKLRKKFSSSSSSNDDPSSFITVQVNHLAQDCDSTLVSLDQKFMGHLEIMKQLQEVIDKSEIGRLSEANICESCNNLKGIIAMIQEQIRNIRSSIMVNDQSVKVETTMAAVQTEAGEVEIDTLNKKLVDSELKHQEEKFKLESLVKDLESSLEQMKQDYDKNEEYWVTKLEEERDMNSEEQRQSDEKLTDLISKISEYEEQFAPKANNSTLPTIDEKDSLEVQFTDLEDEFEKYKNDKDNELKIKIDEIDKLKGEIKSLEQSINSSGNHSLNNKDSSSVSSPIGYLWNQGTIHSPYKVEKKQSVRDYQNPAFAQSSPINKYEESARCSSDGDGEKDLLNPIQRPGLTQRSNSVGTLGGDKNKQPPMIHCSELEGQLQRQHSQTTSPSSSCVTCGVLEHRCRQLQATLRHHYLYLESMQNASRAEGATLRARITVAETAVGRLQQRLTEADMLVKELYIENCQLVQRNHQQLL